MAPDKLLETERLILRPWRESDLLPFAKITSDPEVMRFFPKLLSVEETHEMIGRLQGQMRDNGFTFFATELKSNSELIGFIGLIRTSFKAHFTPAVEIGWRLAKAHWNKGLATEGARRALEHGFVDHGLSEIVSLTATQNAPSRKVMEKIGMTRDLKDDFDHPRVPEGHELKRHVLYRLKREHWQG